jgi:LysR family transcriptional regulator, transcriptional activator of the cysJI operon
MQIETFKIFCDLAETASFSKAATLNGITQSAVSQQIRALEQRFQVTLISRGGRNFSLTPEGEAFLESSKGILNIYDHLSDRLHELQNLVAGDIKIASIYSIGLHELPPFLKQFRTQHPEVEVHVEYRRSPQVYSEVLNGEVDFGLVSYPAKRKGIAIEPFIKDRMVLICHPDHPLAKRTSAALSDFQNEKFIAFEPDAPTRKVIDRLFKDHNLDINHAMEFDNVETVKRAVEIEHGISIVPQNTVRQEVENGNLAAIRIEPEIWRPLGILSRRNRSRSPAQREFLALLQNGGGSLER